MPRRVEKIISESRVTRTPSDLLAEVHVYILPEDKWIPFRRLARNTVVEETVSAGFVRVLPDVTLVDLRQELAGQLADDVPENYAFIKCVGRNFTQVKRHQEQVMKVKSFLPPHADEPEVHIMEISQELLRYAPSLSNLLVSDAELSDSHSTSRLTQNEHFSRSQDLHSWSEVGESKWDLWEGRLSDVTRNYDNPGGAAGNVMIRDHYNLDSGVTTHWRKEGGHQSDDQATEERGEKRDRGDGMSDNRDRRSEERDDEVDEGAEGSGETSEEAGERRARRDSRRNEGRNKRGGEEKGDEGTEDDKKDGRGKSNEGEAGEEKDQKADDGHKKPDSSQGQSKARHRNRLRRETKNTRGEDQSDSDGQVGTKGKERSRGRRSDGSRGKRSERDREAEGKETENNVGRRRRSLEQGTSVTEEEAEKIKVVAAQKLEEEVGGSRLQRLDEEVKADGAPRLVSEILTLNHEAELKEEIYERRYETLLNAEGGGHKGERGGEGGGHTGGGGEEGGGGVDGHEPGEAGEEGDEFKNKIRRHSDVTSGNRAGDGDGKDERRGSGGDDKREDGVNDIEGERRDGNDNDEQQSNANEGHTTSKGGEGETGGGQTEAENYQEEDEESRIKLRRKSHSPEAEGDRKGSNQGNEIDAGNGSRQLGNDENEKQNDSQGGMTTEANTEHNRDSKGERGSAEGTDGELGREDMFRGDTGDSNDVGGNIYARAENGDIVRFRYSGGSEGERNGNGPEPDADLNRVRSEFVDLGGGKHVQLLLDATDVQRLEDEQGKDIHDLQDEEEGNFEGRDGKQKEFDRRTGGDDEERHRHSGMEEEEHDKHGRKEGNDHHSHSEKEDKDFQQNDGKERGEFQRHGGKEGREFQRHNERESIVLQRQEGKNIDFQRHSRNENGEFRKYDRKENSRQFKNRDAKETRDRQRQAAGKESRDQQRIAGKDRKYRNSELERYLRYGTKGPNGGRTENNSNNNFKTRNKRQDLQRGDKRGGAGGGEVGGVMRGRARLRRRSKKGLVTDSEADEEEDFTGSLRQRHGAWSTRYGSTHALTRSASASRVADVNSYAKIVEGKKEGGPKVKRSASEERLGYDPWLYAPHKWYYARIERPPTGEEDTDVSGSGTLEDRKARLKALEEKKHASFDDEGSNSDVPFPRPNVEILSMDGNLRGPLASLQEGVVSGFQVNSNGVDGRTENPPSSRPDHLTLTYEIEVDGEGQRIKKIGRTIGDGKGAWESEVDDGSTEFGGDADGEDTTGAATDDSAIDASNRKTKGSKHNRRRSQDEVSQEKLSNRLAHVLKEKADAENQRQKLFTQAKDLHEEILRIKEKRREQWWRQYNETRKIGNHLEERQTGHRNELDSLHRKIIGSIVRRQPLVTGVKDEPSRKANYKISIIRLRHEIEDLRRRVEAMDIKVETEIRLRNQAEREVKTLRQEVSRKKANMALSQSRASLLRSASHFPPDLLVRM